MRRIPLLLVVIAGALPLAASALAATSRATASPVNTSLPAISGTTQQGHTLTASNGTWSGTAPITYTYRWQRCNASGSSCGNIGGATNQNYVASSGDVGRTIRVAVTGTNADGTSQALSTATDTIGAPGSVPANTKQPDPSGTAQEGKTITVGHGDWTGLQPITFTYQWQSCTSGGTCTNLAGKTGSSLLLGLSQVGLLMRATIVATNAAGKTSAFSNLTAIVLAKATAPANVSLPAISGSAHVGQRLSATSGEWTGVPTSPYTYQWSRCNADGSSCSTIAGATGQTYGVGAADLGLAIRVNVTAKNATGSTTATSAAAKIGARVVLTATFRAVLRAGQEVSYPNGKLGATVGHFTAKVTGTTLRWTLTFSHLTGHATVTRLNKGVRGTNGAAFKSLCRTCLSPTHGTVTLTASQRAAMLRGGTYVNIHTAKNTRGEIRGQISRIN
ncbi:MAG TPA: CHRD domain-containing protein [Gaiellaceae bacterium]|nr:CHRD domain-containing protein [Gaiellaceae bacterium]